MGGARGGLSEEVALRRPLTGETAGERGFQAALALLGPP